MTLRDWNEIETGFGNELESWQNKKNGKVLSVEKCHREFSPVNFHVITLPENFEDDNQIIEVVDEVNTSFVARGSAEVYRRMN